MFVLPGIALPQTQGGVISGRVVALDGTPAAQLRIAAQALLDRDDVALGASMLAGVTQTDDDGKFRLEDVPPGRYYIVIDPLGYPSYYPGVNKLEKAAILSVAQGSQIDGLNFKIPDFDGGKIFGRLALPPYPLNGPVRVTALSSAAVSASNGLGSVVQLVLGSLSPSPNINALLTLLPANSLQGPSSLVNADGTFELPRLRPGSYIVRTVPNIGLSTVTVDVGDVDIHGVELKVPVTGITVRGRVVGDPVPELLSQLTVLLAGVSTPVNPDGTFAIPNIQPGDYIAMTVPSPNVARYSTVEVLDQNIDDLEVVPPFTIEVPGRIELQSGRQFISGKTALSVEGYHGASKPLSATVQPDGTFKLNLLSGENRVVLRNIPAENAVVSMTYDGADILHHPLIPDLGDSDGIHIVLAPVSADSMHKVRGLVEGLPAAAIGPDSRIVLSGAANGRRLVKTPLNPDRTFEFSAVPADTYKAQVAGAPFVSNLEFTVGTEDVDQLRMKGELQVEVSGRVTIVDRQGTILPEFPFSYMAMEFRGSGPPVGAAVMKDGNFAQSLSEDEYSLFSNKLPDGFAVQSISAAGMDLLKGKLKVDGRKIPEIVVTVEYRSTVAP